MSVCKLVGTVCAVTGLASATSTFGVGFENHRIIARGATQWLPEPVAALFSQHDLAFLERSLEPETVWRRDPDMRRRDAWHRVALDVGSPRQSRSARMAAAARFPHTAKGARRLYQDHHLRAGGTLPWEVERLYRELVVAWREGEPADVIRAAGHLTHFAGECASPFNATVNADGRQTGNLILGRHEPGEAEFAHQNVQYRFDHELVNRNGARYAEHAATLPPTGASLIAPADSAFSVLLDSLGCLDDVLAADAEIVARLGVTDAAGFLRRADEYYLLLDQRVGAVCVERLRAGTALAAGLLRGAWEEAGRPTAAEIAARGARAESDVPSLDRASSPPEASDAAPFVGSRNSPVFHRAECRHAQRISPENRVHFRTAADARDQGRRPCRRCNPDRADRRPSAHEK